MKLDSPQKFQLRSQFARMSMVECVAMGLFLISAFVFFPGELTTDSADQLSDAAGPEVNDWHSPMLIHVWRLLLMLGFGQGAMLVLQLACYWAGAMLLAGSLVHAGRPRAGWAILGVAVFPHFVFFNHYILKDTLHYSVMFLATGMIVRAVLSQPLGRGWLLASGLVLVLVCLVRVNAAFGVGPLVVGLIWTPARFRLLRVLLATCVVSVLLIGTARLVNGGLLGAKSSDVEQSIQLFDLAGIHYFSNDGNVWGGARISDAEIRACYTSFYWDVFGVKGICGPMRAKLGAESDGSFDAAAQAKRKLLWARAILTHPLAYLQHRASHFNSAIHFAVPALHARFNKAIRDGSRAGRSAFTERDLWIDYAKKSFIIWPVNWLILGAAVLSLLWPAARTGVDAKLAMSLAASGLGYGLAYAVVGVATDVRYFLWTNLAVLLAAVIGWAGLCQRWRDTRRQCVAWLLGLLLTTGIGLTTRLMAMPFT